IDGRGVVFEQAGIAMQISDVAETLPVPVAERRWTKSKKGTSCPIAEVMARCVAGPGEGGNFIAVKADAFELGKGGGEEAEALCASGRLHLPVVEGGVGLDRKVVEREMV